MKTSHHDFEAIRLVRSLIRAVGLYEGWTLNDARTVLARASHALATDLHPVKEAADEQEA